MTNIKLKMKMTWGKKRFYPNCKNSTLLLKITRRKSFTEKDLATLKELGNSIEIISADIPGEEDGLSNKDQ